MANSWRTREADVDTSTNAARVPVKTRKDYFMKTPAETVQRKATCTRLRAAGMAWFGCRAAVWAAAATALWVISLAVQPVVLPAAAQTVSGELEIRWPHYHGDILHQIPTARGGAYRVSENDRRGTSAGITVPVCAYDFDSGTMSFGFELGGTATAGGDYSIHSRDIGPDEFLSGDSTSASYALTGEQNRTECASFSVILRDDMVDELEVETLTVTVVNLVGGRMLGANSITIQIVDNDVHSGATFHTHSATNLPSVLSEDIFGRERGSGDYSFDPSKNYQISARNVPRRGVSHLEIRFSGTAKLGVDYTVRAFRGDTAREGMVIRNPSSGRPYITWSFWKERRSERVLYFRIKVIDDRIEEDTESIIIEFDPGNLYFDGTRGIKRRTLRLFDNDRPAPAAELGVTISKLPRSIDESLTPHEMASADNFNSANMVILSVPLYSVILSMSFSVEGTATRCADYVFRRSMFPGDSNDRRQCDSQATTGTIRVLQREREFILRLRAVDDGVDESSNETIVINLGENAQGQTVRETINLVDNDSAPLIEISSPSVGEGGPGDSAVLAFEVTKTGETSLPATVKYQIAGSRDPLQKRGNENFRHIVASPITFAANETSKVIEVEVIGNNIPEDDNTVVVSLSNPVNAKFAGSAATIEGIGTILNDDFLEFSIADASATEADANETSIMTFLVTVGADVPDNATVGYVVSAGAASGEATPDKDFIGTRGKVGFIPGGSYTQPINVVITGDDETESHETLTVTLFNAQCVKCPASVVASIKPGEGIATGTILDNEAVQISVSDPEVTEGDAGENPTLEFEVTLDQIRDQSIDVSYSVAASSTALSGTDFAAVSDGTLTFDQATSETSRTVMVTVTSDEMYEEDETVLLVLTSPTGGAVLADSASSITGVGTITNDDDAPLLAFDSLPTVTEGDEGDTTVLRYDITKTGDTSLPVTVDFAISDAGTATGTGDDADYTPSVSSSLTFTATETSKSIEITVIGDGVAESDETVVVTLSNPVHGRFADGAQSIEGAGTITDNDELPLLAFGPPPTVTEGDAGDTTMLRFEVTKAGSTFLPVTVAYAISGTAIASGDEADFTHDGTSLTIPAEQDSAFIEIAVIGDDLAEHVDGDTVTVILSNPVNARFAGGASTQIHSTGTIANDDTLAVSIDAEQVMEGTDGDTTTLTFTATLAARSLQPVTVDYEVVTTGNDRGTADFGTGAGDDYTTDAPTGTLTFAASTAAPQSQTFSVTVNGDLERELNETVIARLSNLSEGAEFAGGLSEILGTGTILNDDAPLFVVSPARVDEGAENEEATLTFTVTMSLAWSEAVTVDYEVAGGTSPGMATVNEDFRETSGTLTFNPGPRGTGGETEKTVAVVVLGDDYDEADEEVVTLTLSNASANAQIQRPEWTGVIVDDDEPPVFSIDSPSVEEGDSEMVNLIFTVSRSGDTRRDTSVEFAVADGTATGGAGNSDDYVPLAGGQLDFAPTEVSKQITVQVRGDSLAEADETVLVTLSNPVLATLAPNGATGIGTIVDDEQFTLAIDSPSVDEGDIGQDSTLTFTATLGAQVPATVTVDFEVTGESATEGMDFAAVVPGTFTFPAGGELTQELDITVTGDELAEGSETLIVTIYNPNCVSCPDGATPIIVTATGKGTIIDNDAPLISISSPSASEGNAGDSQTLVFEVTLDSPWHEDVAVDYSIDTQRTTAGDDDFENPTGETLRFDSSQSAVLQTIQIPITGDAITEDDETVVVVLSNATGDAIFAGGATTATGTGTIVNDDFDYLVVGPSSGIIEPETGSAEMTFTVTLDPPATSETSVRYVFGGTATEGFDYTDATQNAAAGVLTFEAGEFSKTIRTLVHSDFVAELTETVIVTLVDASGTPIESATASGSILPPSSSVDGVTIEVESPQVSGDDEAPTVEFDLRLSATQSSTVEVSWVLGEVVMEADDPPPTGEFGRNVGIRVSPTSELIRGTATVPAGATNATVSSSLVDRLTTSGIEGPLALELERPTGVAGIEVQQADGISNSLQAAADSNGRVAVVVFNTPQTTAESADWAATSALSAFGRSAATSLVNVIWSRAEAHRHGEAASHASLGGRSVDVSAFSSDTDARQATRETARILGIESVAVASLTTDGADGEPIYSGDFDAFMRWADLPNSDDIARGSSFALNLGHGPASRSTFVYWGSASTGSFGSELEHDEFSKLTADGSTTTVNLGIDYRMNERVQLGLALSSVSGSVEYSFDEEEEEGSGELSPSLTSATPWLRWQSPTGLEVWGAAGIGWGSAEVTHDSDTTEMDMSSRIIAAGYWSQVATVRGIGIAAKADAFMASLSTDGGSDAVDDAGADAQRIRLAAEMGPRLGTDGETPLSYSFELGARHDGGDAESGMGVDAAANFSYSNPGGGIEVSGRGSFLLFHGQEGFSEMGMGLLVAYAPGTDARGLQLSLEPAWNAPRSNAADSMWNMDSSGDLSLSSSRDATVRARLGYGVGAIQERVVATVYGETETGGPEQRLRLGTELRGQDGPLERLRFDIYGEREQGRLSLPENAIMLEARTDF